MVADKVEIGPFIGGLNTSTDPSSINDNDVAELLNMELEFDGALATRPPFCVATDPLTTGDGISVLGFFSLNGTNYLIANDRDEATYSWDGSVWTLITNDFAADDIVQYRDKLHLVHNTEHGGTWDGTTFTQNNNMPTGNRIVLFKDRLWISKGRGATNASRVYVSDFDISDPVLWNGDFFTISGGDGQDVIDILPYYDSLVIFKTHSTYRFAFDTNPALGVLTLVSGQVGLADTGCAVQYENTIFTMYGDSIYDFTNYQYVRLNDKINLTDIVAPDRYSSPFALSVWDDRLFVSYKGKCYVYGIRTRSWSEWQSDRVGVIGRVIPVPGGTEVPKAVVESFDTAAPQVPIIEYGDKTIAASTSSPTTWEETMVTGADPGDVLIAVVRTTSSTPISAMEIDGNEFTLLESFSPGPSIMRVFTLTLDGDDISEGEITMTSSSSTFPGKVLINFVRLRNVKPESLVMETAAGENTPVIERSEPNSSLSVIWASVQGSTYGTISSPPADWEEAHSAEYDTGSANTSIKQVFAHKDVTGLTINPGTWDLTYSSTPYTFMYIGHINIDFSTEAHRTAFCIEDKISSEEENYTCRIKTKYYDFGDPANFKRLMWWGVDCIINTPATGILDPTEYVSDKTWDELDSYTWDSADLYAWERPLLPSTTISDFATIGYDVTGRKFIKFIRSCRFRKLSFELQFDVDGTDTTAIAKVFRLVSIIRQKAKVPKRVN